jgi:hypothetical protein
VTIEGFVTSAAASTHIPETFSAAAELGKGAVARAFKNAEIDALALRLVSLKPSSPFFVFLYRFPTFNLCF